LRGDEAVDALGLRFDRILLQEDGTRTNERLAFVGLILLLLEIGREGILNRDLH